MAGKRHSKRLYWGQVKRDPYVLGIVCEKTGLSDLAERQLKRLKQIPPRGELFLLGRVEANEHTLREVARDLWEMRKVNDPRQFDSLVLRGVGRIGFVMVRDAIAEYEKHPERRQRYGPPVEELRRAFDVLSRQAQARGESHAHQV